MSLSGTHAHGQRRANQESHTQGNIASRPPDSPPSSKSPPPNSKTLITSPNYQNAEFPPLSGGRIESNQAGCPPAETRNKTDFGAAGLCSAAAPYMAPWTGNKYLS
ncbi:hypothetical protein RRG08_019200 [Elysia crispata]|uniref:Uncharacterized protein n=1 Tax=Elysia crispata TaxID=231223 RepID=A0AAE1ATB3_9GAST|nr:hypothetical protein RRG08_019200 [Elysia crispata]